MSAWTEAQRRRRPSPFWKLVKEEGRLALREPYGIIFGIGLPILLLVIFGSIPAFTAKVAGTSLTVFEIYVPILMVTVLIMLGLIGLPVPLARDREIGWLRRVSTTPVSPARLLAAHVVINLVLVTCALGILLAGGASFGLGGEIEFPGFVLSSLLVTAAMFSLGLVIAAIANSQGVARGLSMILLFPLLFFAGIYVPVNYLPGYLQTASHLTPVGAAVEALGQAMQGSFPSAEPLLVMVAYAVILGFLANHYFRWE